MTTPTNGSEGGSAAASGGGVTSIVRQWNGENIVKKASLGLRGLCFIFSLLAFIVMVSNRHGDWKNFDRYEEYRYVLAIAILSALYTGLQSLREIHQLYSGREYFSRQNLSMVEFFGDQIVAYLLISAASSAVPLTNKMREGADNIFTDASASAISMEFLAFFTLALSAIVSGYKLANQSYV